MPYPSWTSLPSTQTSQTSCHTCPCILGRSYEFSKLKKFLTLTRFIMEDTLRFLVEESLTRYVTFLTAACAAKVRVLLGSTSSPHEIRADRRGHSAQLPEPGQHQHPFAGPPSLTPLTPLVPAGQRREHSLCGDGRGPHGGAARRGPPQAAPAPGGAPGVQGREQVRRGGGDTPPACGLVLGSHEGVRACEAF